MEDSEILEMARAQIRAEAEGLMEVAAQLDNSFIEVVHLVNQCKGLVLITGSGTSGMMARRLAHLLCSCGIRSFYIHPGEALHGPSATVEQGDLLIAFSKAGKSSDLNQFIEIAKQRGSKIVSVTWNAESEMAKLGDVLVIVRPSVSSEGEGILPFGSSLANGAFGDALCLIAQRLRGFDFAQLKQTHPAGATAELV
jgi:D-arabinose 5-phosphate isomerase GutQ